MMVIILCCCVILCVTAGRVAGAFSVPFTQPERGSVSPLLDQTRRDWLSTGFLIYGPLYKKGLGTQHSLSNDIESQLPSMEMWVVCYSVKAYLHCAVKLSVVTTGCLLTLALKFIFACGAVWSRHVRDIFGEKVQWRQIAFTLTGLWLCLLLQCGTREYIQNRNGVTWQVQVCAPALWGDACFALFSLNVSITAIF